MLHYALALAAQPTHAYILQWFLAHINNGSNDKTLLNIFLDKFIADAKVNNRPKTYQTKVSRTDKYVRPNFGQRCMKSIKVSESEIKDWINTDLSHLSNKTICEVLTPFRSAFHLGIEDEVISVNPFNLIKNPKKRKKKIIQILLQNNLSFDHLITSALISNNLKL